MCPSVKQVALNLDTKLVSRVWLMIRHGALALSIKNQGWKGLGHDTFFSKPFSACILTKLLWHHTCFLLCPGSLGSTTDGREFAKQMFSWARLRHLGRREVGEHFFSHISNFAVKPAPSRGLETAKLWLFQFLSLPSHSHTRDNERQQLSPEVAEGI